ncbi:MAG TPA: hypothetical protein VFN48_02865 [Solirubrobacteraceae bacterium]|nr:hypothetical protein [Solirubrobacteraceae bacterium]
MFGAISMTVNARLLQSLNEAHQADLRRPTDGDHPRVARRHHAWRSSRARRRRADA